MNIGRRMSVLAALAVFAACESAITPTGPPPRSPAADLGLAAGAPIGFAYVANFNSDDVSVIRTSDNTVTATVGVGMSPVGVAVTPAISDPGTVLADLADVVEALENDGMLNQGQANSLLAQLDQVSRLLDRGGIQAALNTIDDFISHVEDLESEGVLSQAEADALVAEAEFLEGLIEGG